MKASSLLSTVGLCGALLAYSNADALLELRTQRLAPARLNPGHLAMLAFVLSWGWAERLTLRDLGLQIRGIGRSLGWGLAVGVVGSVAVAVFFAFPIVSRDAITHPEFRRLSFSRLMWMLCGQLLISTAAFEEVAFRGVLHAKLTRLLGERRALGIGAAIFAAWHAVITWYNLRRSNLPRRRFGLLYVGAMANFWVAGVLFGLIRQRTGHLAGGILAHWLIVSNIVIAVARPRRPPL